MRQSKCMPSTRRRRQRGARAGCRCAQELGSRRLSASALKNSGRGQERGSSSRTAGPSSGGAVAALATRMAPKRSGTYKRATGNCRSPKQNLNAFRFGFGALQLPVALLQVAFAVPCVFAAHAGYRVLPAAVRASGVRARAEARFSQVICECIKKFRPGAGKGLQFSDGGPQFWGRGRGSCNTHGTQKVGNLQKGDGQL